MIMALTWTKCGKRPLKQMAEYLGIKSIRTLVNLCSGMDNKESSSRINEKIAKKIGAILDIDHNIFMGKKGILFESSNIKNREAVLVLYRRLKYLVKHTGIARGDKATEGKPFIRIERIDAGFLDDLDAAWNGEEWGKLDDIKAELKKYYSARTDADLSKSVRALRKIEEKIVDDIQITFKAALREEKSTSSYRKMVGHFRYGSSVVASTEKIRVVTEAMNNWTFDALRELDDIRLLERYQKALLEQQAYVGVILRILKKNK